MNLSSKRLRTSLPGTGTDVDIVTSGSLYIASPSTSISVTCKDGQTGSSIFTDNILPVILDNLRILTPANLLQIRLVNRSWRTAATSVLLKRNACQIVLKTGEVPLSADDNIRSHTQLLGVCPSEFNYSRDPPIFKYYSAKPPHDLLPELIQLISTSHQFPSNSLKFLEGCEKALTKLRLALPKEDYWLEEDELMRLFSLWGKDVKALSIGNRISWSTVEKLLFLYTPNLRSLDFANCHIFDVSGPKQKLNQVFHVKGEGRRSPNLNLTLKKLEEIIPGAESSFHWTKADFLKQLLRISPNIRSVQEVGAAALSVLIVGNAHLIKSLSYNPSLNQQFTSLLSEVRPLGRHNIPFLQPSQLAIKLSSVSRKHYAYGDVVRVLNLILRGSKDTLEYLELHVNPQDFLENIRIPTLGKLKCLKLVQEKETFGNLLQSRKANRERAKRAGEENIDAAAHSWVYDRHVFQFENEQNPHRIPPDYFPQLAKVVLHCDPGSINTCNKLLALFSLEHSAGWDQSVVSGDVVSSVTSLELSPFPDVDKKLGKLFPNVSHLRITCAPGGRKLCNWVWGAFLALESFEIYDFIPDMDKEDVDSFFIGIPTEVCTTFPCYEDSVAVPVPAPELSHGQIKFYRTQPYIGNCGNLREFTIHFEEKISRLFATKMSLLYGFQGVTEQTRIIFSFESLKLSQQEMEEVGAAALSVLIVGNAHLIKSLSYNPSLNQQFTSLLSEVRPLGRHNIPFLQPSQLAIKLSSVSRKHYAYGDVVRVLNLILRGSKDTLEYLELHVNPQDFLENIRIPTLGKLKCLKLVQEKETFGNLLQSRKANRERAKRAGEENIDAAAHSWVYDRHVFQFENEQNPHRIPPDYFPQLAKVVLHCDPGSINTCNKLLALFSLEHSAGWDQSVVSGDVVSSVTSLELSPFPDVDKKLGKLFPNVSHLRITCAPGGRKLCNWVWGAFLALESFEIYDFIPDMDKEDVDSFFIGIPTEVCTTFPCYEDSVAVPVPVAELSPGQIKFYRTQPYIGNCGNLREFTIHFEEKISRLFATKMSLLYGFQGVTEQTRIIFSFESLKLSQQEMEDVQKHLEPLAAYIIIRE